MQMHNQSEAGFTLIEVVVAIGLVTLILTGFLGMRTDAVADGMEARNWRLARELAEEKLSELQAGARETPPISGQIVDLEKYHNFSYQIMIGESAIGELEAKVAEEAADENREASARTEWQRNRDVYRKASSQGQNYSEYQDQVAQDDSQRELAEQVPDEKKLEDVAVAVFFPKLNAHYQGQREAFVIKAKASTLALSGLTLDQAKIVADSKGQATGSTGAAASGAALPGAAASTNGGK